jgi:hypothetical protein
MKINTIRFVGKPLEPLPKNAHRALSLRYLHIQHPTKVVLRNLCWATSDLDCAAVRLRRQYGLCTWGANLTRAEVIHDPEHEYVFTGVIFESCGSYLRDNFENLL